MRNTRHTFWAWIKSTAVGTAMTVGTALLLSWSSYPTEPPDSFAEQTLNNATSTYWSGDQRASNNVSMSIATNTQ